MQAKGRFVAGTVLGLLLFTPVDSHAQENSIHANIRGGGGDGKCTFEVEVGGVAEVEIRGDQGYVRTISGSPARWRRLDCNQPLPTAPNDFRFKGIDGRGRQNLVRDPNSNRGAAVIRIEDSKGGREGYTGDIMWRGGSGNSDFARDRSDRRAERQNGELFVGRWQAPVLRCGYAGGRAIGTAARQRGVRERFFVGVRRSRYLGGSRLQSGFRSRLRRGCERRRWMR